MELFPRRRNRERAHSVSRVRDAEQRTLPATGTQGQGRSSKGTWPESPSAPPARSAAVEAADASAWTHG